MDASTVDSHARYCGLQMITGWRCGDGDMTVDGGRLFHWGLSGGEQINYGLLGARRPGRFARGSLPGKAKGGDF
jgi:hypothetical protein